jgi:hypothetical protein
MAFPINLVLDDFNRADEGPPPGTNWTNFLVPSSSDSRLALVSNELKNDIANSGSAYWNPGTFGPDTECFITVGSVIPPVGHGVELYVRAVSVSTSGLDGYYLFFWNFGGGTPTRMYISRVDNNVATQLGATYSEAGVMVPGDDMFGVEILGDTINGYRNATGTWVKKLSRNDTTYTAAGYIGPRLINSTLMRLDDFGGGTAEPVTFPTTGVLDTFTDADATVLSAHNANWSTSSIDNLDGVITILSNAAYDAATGTTKSNYWLPIFGPDTEVFATLVTPANNTYLFMRLQSPGSFSVDGYAVNFNLTAPNQSFFFRNDNDSYTQLGATETPAFIAGDQLGGSVVGSTITMYRNGYPVSTRSDGTYGSSGRIGMHVNTGSADNFGGGTVVVPIYTGGPVSWFMDDLNIGAWF